MATGKRSALFPEEETGTHPHPSPGEGPAALTEDPEAPAQSPSAGAKVGAKTRFPRGLYTALDLLVLTVKARSDIREN